MSMRSLESKNIEMESLEKGGRKLHSTRGLYAHLPACFRKLEAMIALV